MTKKNLKADIKIMWPNWKEVVNEAFIPVMDDTSDFLILYGGRSSSKSYSLAVKCVFMMLEHKHCKILMIRNAYAHIRESCYDLIIQVIQNLGLEHQFSWRANPFTIECVNGNKAIGRGLDKPRSIKSLNDLTCIWFEEEFPENSADFSTIVTTLRTKSAKYLQVMFSINPEVYHGAFEDNWFWKRFFQDHIGELTFRTEEDIEVDDGKKKIKQRVFVHHSTYKDNPHIDDSTKANLEKNKYTDPDKYITHTLGLWGNKERTGLFYPLFNRAKNTLINKPYDLSKPLHLSVDENVAPYMAATIYQLDLPQDGVLSAITSAYCIDELQTVKHHSVENLCSEFIKKYPNHTAGLFIYGDVSMKKRSTLLEAGWNGYKIMTTMLEKYNPTLRVPSHNPSLKARSDFINSLFNGGINDCEFIIAEKCKVLLSDLMDVQTNKDGGKEKKVVKRDGKSFQVNAHASDSMDYFLCQIFDKEMYRYLNGSSTVRPKFGVEPFNAAHKY